MAWLPEEFSKARILSVNYDAYITTSTKYGTVDLYNTAESLMADLKIAKVGQHPVILVGHSYGGLVIKQLCYEAHNSQSLKGEEVGFLNYVRGVFFYGTPHRGSLFLSSPNGTQLKVANPLLEYVKVLCTESARLHEWFDSLRGIHKWSIAGVGESRPTTFLTPEPRTRVLEKQKMALSSEVHSEEFVDVRNILRTFPGVALVGMSGIGKTTLAKQLFNELCADFEYTCFFQLPKKTIKEDYKNQLESFYSSLYHHGIKVEQGEKVRIRNLIELRSKKLLLVIDDMDSNFDFLEEIRNKSDCADSRYIVTGIDLHDVPLDIAVFKVGFLDFKRSKKLFMSYAFPNATQPDPFMIEWINKIVAKCEGLPLTLQVMGNYISGERQDMKEVSTWRKCLDALNAAEAISDWDERLWAKLEVSYNSLHLCEKEIFLDVATFFVNSIWKLQEAKSCWRVVYGLEDVRWRILVDLSLVYDVNEKDNIQMHEQMRSLGIRLAAAWGDNCMCRTWNKKNVLSASSSTATELKEIIALRLEDSMPFNSKSIGQMKKLRYLDSEKELMLDEVGGELSKTVVLLRLRGKVNSLHDLVDRGRFCLVVLNLKAPLRCLPTSVNELQNLEFLKFEACLFGSLPETFGQLPRLRHLTFSSCKKLRSLPKSFGQLSKLQSLKLYDCKLRALPDSFVQLPRLKTLIMVSLHNLERLPEDFGNLYSLKSLLIIDVHNISKLPESFCSLPRLDTLIMYSLHNLQRLPEGFGNLSQLETLSIVHAHKISKLPESFCSLPQLKTLIMYSLHNLQRLPEDFENLSQLTLLLIIDVPNMAFPPNNFCRPDPLRNLKIRDVLGFEDLPGNFMQFSDLEVSEDLLVNILKNVNFFSHLWTLS
ncbi:hypothetical protein AXG93_815s1000 [Marchantia polymorpha subsp. ruderalis]|uniref:Uncharacterized protein n=1 Tax=Marchantia polymorpha subsp. ruderalis TaxID=1480154 RepID=A0A176W046_MARPO|nr:hypothetical protein AXG93_815s1000 [Marchantia polymorpha subsp. ruderalis]